MPKRSETRARNYTVEELKRLGWNTRHPNRGGHILEENEIFNFDERFKELLQLDKPDYLIFKNNKPIAIIECKSDKTKFDEAVKEQVSQEDIKTFKKVASTITELIGNKNIY